MQFVIIFALIVSILAVMFSLSNTEIVQLHFLMWTFNQPLALFLLIAIAVGALIISILTIPGWLKSRQLRKKHRKEVAELEDNLAKYRSNLIDAQNSNKDLRQKIIEIEEAKQKLEDAQKAANQEIEDLHNALNQADLTAQEAQQARKEAMDARDNINLALRELEIKLDSAEDSAETYKGLLDKMSESLPYALPGSGGEVDTLAEEAALDELPSDYQEESPADEAIAADPEEDQGSAETEEEKPAEEKRRFFRF